MKLSKVYTALFLTLPLANSALAVDRLDEISVIALRDASSFSQEANTTVNVDRQALQTKQPTTVAEALKNVPNISIEGGDRPSNQQPDIRGMTGNRVAQVIDGVKQSFELMNRGAYFLPLSMVQDLEVVKGPASTLWGNGALGGVVAMRTPTALDLLDDGASFGAKINQGYQSANNLRESSAMLFSANEEFDALLGGFYNHAHNLRLGGGEELKHSGFTQKGGLVKLGWQLDDSNRVTLSHRFTRVNQTSPNDNSLPDEKDAKPIDFLTMDRNHLAQYKYTFLSRQEVTDQSTVLDYTFNPDSAYVDAHLSVYHNKTKEVEDWVRKPVHDETSYTTTGVNLRNSSDFDWMYLTYGVDFAHSKVDTTRQLSGDDYAKHRANEYDGNIDNTGVYLLGHIPFFNKKLVFSPGIRYDHYKNRGKGVFEDFQGNKLNEPTYSKDHYSPSLAITWKPLDFLTLSTKYNEAFRAPSLQESFSNGSLFFLKLRVPRFMMGMINPAMIDKKTGLVNFPADLYANPQLKPEVSQNKEITANFHFDNVFTGGDNLMLNATYFHNTLKDAISPQLVYKHNMVNGKMDMGLVGQYTNIPKARITGFELDLMYRTERLGLGLGYGEAKGKVLAVDASNPLLADVSVGDPLDDIPAKKLSLNADYFVIPETLNVGAVVTHYAAQKNLSKSYLKNWGDPSKPFSNYTLTDLHMSVTPKAVKDLRVDFAITNLFDEKYRSAFANMDGVGRNFKVNLGYKF